MINQPMIPGMCHAEQWENIMELMDRIKWKENVFNDCKKFVTFIFF